MEEGETLKPKVKQIIVDIVIYSIIILAIVGLVKIGNHLSNESDEMYKQCLQYHSTNYCDKSIYGVYP